MPRMAPWHQGCPCLPVMGCHKRCIRFKFDLDDRVQRKKMGLSVGGDGIVDWRVLRPPLFTDGLGKEVNEVFLADAIDMQLNDAKLSILSSLRRLR